MTLTDNKIRRRKTTALKRALHLLLKLQLGIQKIEIIPFQSDDFPTAKFKISLTVRRNLEIEEPDHAVAPVFPDWQLLYIGANIEVDGLDGGERKIVFLLERV